MADSSKWKAAGKIALGVGRMGSGILTACGTGLLGSFLRNHHMMNAAVGIGRMSMEGGLKMLEEGLDEWDHAK